MSTNPPTFSSRPTKKPPAKSSTWPKRSRNCLWSTGCGSSRWCTRVLDNAKRRRRILSLVQDALGQLRLDMKYLTFDLEATRRERDDYRQKLEGTA